MVDFEIGKREHNKVEMKLNILKAFIKAMESDNLNDIKVEEVCKSIHVSKVTFFNYFSSKEEVVEYFIQLWQFEMAYDIGEKKLSGKETILYLLENVSLHPSVKSIMSALTVFFAKIECYRPTRLSDYELFLYNKKAYELGYKSTPLYEIILKAVNQLCLKENKRDILVTNIMSGFYGIPLVSSLGFGENLSQMYKDYINNLIDKEISYDTNQ